MYAHLALSLLQDDAAYELGRIVGYIVGFLCCMSGIIIPIVALIWTLKKRKATAPPPPPQV